MKKYTLKITKTIKISCFIYKIKKKILITMFYIDMGVVSPVLWHRCMQLVYKAIL